MAEPITASASLKNLVKSPLFYVIAVFTITGGCLVSAAGSIGPVWYVGVAVLTFACLMLLIQVVASLFDSSFKRRYTIMLKSQDKMIKTQLTVIDQLSKNVINAHNNATLNVSEPIAGGYTRTSGGGSETPTS